MPTRFLCSGVHSFHDVDEPFGEFVAPFLAVVCGIVVVGHGGCVRWYNSDLCPSGSSTCSSVSFDWLVL